MQHRDAVLDVLASTTALTELFHAHQAPLHRFLRGMLRNQAEADDALQQVFLRLVENGPAIRLETAKSWLFTVAYHEALVLRRLRNRQEAALTDLWARPVWLSARAAPSPEEQAVRNETIQSVHQSLAALPAPQREVVERRLYKNQPFAAIAADLNCPVATVLTRMRRAIKALAKALEK